MDGLNGARVVNGSTCRVIISYHRMGFRAALMGRQPCVQVNTSNAELKTSKKIHR